jgi:hypothetical protein
METETVVYLNIIQFVIVMQDGKDHNVSKPIVVHISHLSIQCYTCMLDDYCEHCNDHVHYKLLGDIQFLFHIFYHSNTTDQRSDVTVRMVGQEINVKQKLVVILALVMEMENVVYLNIIQFVIVMQDCVT